MRVQKCFFSIFVFVLNSIFAQTAFPPFTVTVNNPGSQGYYFTVPIKIGPGAGTFQPTHMILDHNGSVVYYKKFTGNCNDFKLHANGKMSYSRGNRFYIMDSAFTITDSVLPKNGMAYDGHDLQILPNGNFLILGYENVTMNLSGYNLFSGNNSPGSASATVKCGIIQEQDQNKNVVFEWHCKDHYSFADVDPAWLVNPNNVDWTHLNAVHCDNDGNFLLSVRHFNEITKVKRSDSSVMWRLGGNANQFVFVNDPAKFKAQHDARRVSNGNITLFDNGENGNPVHAAAAKEYKLNESTLTATLVWSYTENPSAYSRALGNTQRLSGGKTLINYGWYNGMNRVFNVVDSAGNKIFEMNFMDTLRSYRSFNFPVIPWDLKRPAITCSFNGSQIILAAAPGHASYLWSNGATTQTVAANLTGTYNVWVPKGQGGFISSPTYTLNNLNACNITALKENSSVPCYEIFPNPFSGQISVKTFSESENSRIFLYDITGREVHSRLLPAEKVFSIDLQTLPSGFYFIELEGLRKKILKTE